MTTFETRPRGATAVATSLVTPQSASGRLAVGLGILGRGFYLNCLWLLGCVPVVTAPGATAALFASVHAWRHGGAEPTAATFFAHLRTTWRRGLLLATAMAGASALVVIDVLLVQQMGSQRWIAVGAMAVVVEAAAVSTVFTFVSLGRHPSATAIATLRESGGLALAAPLRAMVATGVVALAGVALAVVPSAVMVVGVAVALVLEELAGDGAPGTSG